VPVEFFCSCALGAEGGGIGELQFLIGVREQEANHVMQERQHTGDLELRNMEHGSTTQERQARMRKRLDQISEWSASSSDSDTSSEMSVPHPEISVWVDLGSEQLTILRWTPGVVSLLQQPLPDGAGFLTWLVREQRQYFLVWLQPMSTENTVSSRSIILRLPCQGGRKSWKRFFTCTCSVLDGAEETLETNNPSEVKVVRLDLHEYQQIGRGSPNAWDSKQTRSQPKILLWVGEQTKHILKRKHAPGSMFRWAVI